MNRSVLFLTISIAITACKIEVSVPEGGRVDASSGNYICTVDQTCEIDVIDFFFDETFIATPEAGYEFRGWRKEARHFCGGLSGNCRLQTAWFEGFDVFTSFLESDGVFYLRPIFEQPDTWTSRAKMNNEHTEFSGCIINGKLYAIGGRQGSVQIPAWSDSVEEYDPETDQWKVVGQVPTRRKFATASALNGKCFVIGGQIGVAGSRGTATAAVESFDPSTGQWEKHADLITGRFAAASAAIGDKLYVVGGTSGSTLATLEVYDPDRDSWSQKASMSGPRGYLGAGVIDSKLYVVGGGAYLQAPALDLVEEYNPASDSWRIRSAMPKPKYFFAAAVFDRKLYAFGGHNDYLQWEDSTTVYDPAENSWRIVASMPTSRAGHVALSAAQKIYILGGSSSSENVLTLEYTP